MLRTLTDSDVLALLKAHLSIGDWTSARLRELPMAYTSRFWQLDIPGRSFVIKEFFPENEDNPLYPTLPRQEADALSVLAKHGLAPDLEAFFETPTGSPMLVYGYPAPRSREIDVREAAELIGRIASLPEPVPWHQTVPAGFEEVLARGDAMLAMIPQSRKAANLKRLRPKDGGGTGAVVPRKLVHRSFCLGTIQATGFGARLIDWQFAGLGDPVEDIAGFLSPGLATLYGLHALVAYAEEMFLAHYPDQDTAARYLEERPAYHWQFAAYCLYRQETLVHKNAPAARAYGKALEAEVDFLLKTRS
ncbi:aminoglycoside phosphotransferase family protein [Roseibium denhamense]|uniref:Phosphotransferase enzyme family protein n=1 Tax=Roseibium denhamense TaxID=76305 RepID=A0ABY1NJE5_9HYPH|nr:phosphotransferase [Roseibium denhamense]MTI06712.1 aminoglycoside phosphotransferase family protein [Roseibium denhamense]SMP10483.1 Phosphotransferase enzyme family protein [Roseibium denhamense]